MTSPVLPALKPGRPNLIPHLVVAVGIAVTAFPLWVAFVASTLSNPEIAQAPMPLLPGNQAVANYGEALMQGGRSGRILTPPVWEMMLNSTVMALTIAVGKIVISILSAYAVVFFRFPFRMAFFWMIFITLMLPVEVRIVPTIQVITNLNMMNSYAGLTIPLIASATATLLFRQFFMTIPDELVEAAQIDGAGPMKFFRDMVLPLSVTNIAALFVILFLYGWNQYLWPLLIGTDARMQTIVIGMSKMIDSAGGPTDWNMVMATAMLPCCPPFSSSC